MFFSNWSKNGTKRLGTSTTVSSYPSNNLSIIGTIIGWHGHQIPFFIILSKVLCTPSTWGVPRGCPRFSHMIRFKQRKCLWDMSDPKQQPGCPQHPCSNSSFTPHPSPLLPHPSLCTSSPSSFTFNPSLFTLLLSLLTLRASALHPLCPPRHPSPFRCLPFLVTLLLSLFPSNFCLTPRHSLFSSNFFTSSSPHVTLTPCPHLSPFLHTVYFSLLNIHVYPLFINLYLLHSSPQTPPVSNLT